MFYFKDEDSISVIFPNGSTGSWKSTHPMFNKVCEAAKKSDWIQIETLQNINNLMVNEGKFENDKVIIKGKEYTREELKENKLYEFINLLRRKGIIESDIEQIKPFLSNLVENPYIDALTELYDFCKAMDFEITDDGCFLAYKKVRSDLGSVYDNGQTKHIIGEYTEVSDFDTNRENVCSRGLHFCSHGYLQSYPGSTILIVKINPKDVVSIPVDYNYEKGRCKKYLPIAAIGNETLLEDLNLQSFGCVRVIRTCL